jgi:hypothetical protein
MKTTNRTARLALVMLGGAIAASLILSVACELPPRGGSEARADRQDAAAIAYRHVAFDRELHGCITGPEADMEACVSCHHEEPDAAGKACVTCHSRGQGHFSKEFGAFVPKLKDAMHNADTGCRGCHEETTEDGLWQCSQCHAGLNEP